MTYWSQSVVAQEQSRDCPESLELENLRCWLNQNVWSVYLSPSVLGEYTPVPFTLLMKLHIVDAHNEQYLGGGLFDGTSCDDRRTFRFCGV